MLMLSRARTLALTILAFTVAALHATMAAAATDPLATLPSLTLGPYEVACSDVAQNFTPPAGGVPTDYWEGQPVNGQIRYVTEILTEPAWTVGYTVQVPDDSQVFSSAFAGHPVDFVAIVCYPTTANNPRPSYPIPGESAVPHMQRAGQLPIFADASARYPVVAFSHGLGGSPMASEYLQSMQLFATHGYVTIAPFHADRRFSRIRLNDFNDVVYLVRNMDQLNAMQAMRPVALRGAIDTLLAHPHYRDHVDPNAIGGFGASLGGQAMLLLAGAKLTVSFGLSSKQVMPPDTRFKAMVGYVPYSGQRLLPAFGDDQNGTRGLTTPFMAIGGTADTTAPLSLTEQAVNNMVGTRFVISQPGVGHGLESDNVPEVFTWAIVFLDAHLKDTATRRQARTRLARMQRVIGGTDESVSLDVLLPAPPLPGEALVQEFYNVHLNHYFITPYTAEADNIILNGSAGPGWDRTRLNFGAWQDNGPTGVPVCRFYGTPGKGPNSHFFTADAGECAAVKKDPGWTFEGTTMRVLLTTDGVCPLDSRPVYRAYNNRFAKNDSNHRYLTSRSMVREMVGQGWLYEGTVFCAAP